MVREQSAVEKMRRKTSTTFLNGEVYKIVVCKVTARDEYNRPIKFDVLYDEQTTNIEGGEMFWLGYFPRKMHERKAGN